MFKSQKKEPEAGDPLPHPYPGMGDKLSGIRQRAGRRINLDDSDPYLRMLGLFPLAGLGLVIYAVIKYLNAIIPVHLTNVAWELNTLGSIAENSITLFLGVTLLFSFRSGTIVIWKLALLYRLSWFLLVLSIIHLGLVPLGALDTARLYSIMDQGYDQAIATQERNWNKIEYFIDNSRDTERLDSIATRLKLAAIYEARQEAFPGDTLIERKEWLKLSASNEYDELRKQARLNHEGELTTFYKLSLRTNGLLLLVGFLFLVMWFKTGWLRHLYNSRGEIAGYLNEMDSDVKPKVFSSRGANDT